MGKLAENPHGLHRPIAKRKLHRLRDERRKLSGRLAKLDRQLAQLAPPTKDKQARNSAALNRWFDELSEALDRLPSLPNDFSRTDLYDDHD
jgi:hypothetical protein